jgi:hypothetical protein
MKTGKSERRYFQRQWSAPSAYHTRATFGAFLEQGGPPPKFGLEVQLIFYF